MTTRMKNRNVAWIGYDMTALLSALLCFALLFFAISYYADVTRFSFFNWCISFLFLKKEKITIVFFVSEWKLNSKLDVYRTRILSLKLSSTILCALGNIAFYIAIQFNVHLIVITTFSFFFVLCSRMHGSWIWLQHFWKL